MRVTVPSSFQGSSPLARGLLGGEARDEGPEMDHPRSRGVYLGDDRLRTLAQGSSPLARGLLVVDGKAGAGDRIIPARAGFTCGRRALLGGPRDHPRSRGVYSAATSAAAPAAGSSPLARGLLAHLEAALRVEGIIPARAGFTRVGLLTGLNPKDHPRSRGVYGPAHRRARDHAGSSPLARGLLSRT